MTKPFLAAAAVAWMGATALVPNAHAGAAYSIAIMEDGRNVDFLGSGNFDTAGDFKADTNVSLHLAFLSDALSITVGTDGAGADFCWPTKINGPASIDTGLVRTYLQGASSGGVAGFEAVAKGHALIVPTGYVSGAALSGTAVASNETLSSISLTPGVYTWTYGAGGADTLTIDVAAPLPEPTSLMLIGLTAAWAMVARRRCV